MISGSSRWEVLIGDAAEVLKALPEGSVSTVVTSPPYYSLRAYDTEQWEGGDESCEHSSSPARGGRGGSGPNSKNGSDEQYPSEVPDRVCEKCGARRVDTQLGVEPLHDCRRWATGGKNWELCGGCYVCGLTRVMREVWRVLRDDGVCLINIGDSYAGSGRGLYGDGTSHGTDGAKQLSNRGSIGVSTTGPKVPCGLKPKDLMAIPWRVGLALQADGWWLRAPLVWAKGASFGSERAQAREAQLVQALMDAGVEVPDLGDGEAEGYVGNSMPGSQRDRPTLTHEHVLLLSKNERYYWDWFAVREASLPDSQKRIQQRTFDEQQGGERDYGTSGVNPNNSARKALENWASTGGTHRQLRSVWCINTQPCDWEFCGACGTLFEGRERSRIEKRKVCNEETGKDKTVRVCPCGATNDWVDHYALMAPRLAEVCVAAGSPEVTCGKCGAPWVREVKREPMEISRSGRGDAIGADIGRTQPSGTMTKPPRCEMLGWKPSCVCSPSDPSGRGVVLDPFSGSATTGVAALAAGRDYIGSDLSENYSRVGQARLARVERRALPEADDL